MPISRDFLSFSSIYAGSGDFYPTGKVPQITAKIHAVPLKSGAEWERGGIEPPVPLLVVNLLPSSLERNSH